MELSKITINKFRSLFLLSSRAYIFIEQSELIIKL